MKFALLLLVLVSQFLAGCGRDKADAMKNYKDLPLTPKKQVQSDSIDKFKAFRISCHTCEQENKPLNFNDGESGQIKFKLEALDPNIKSALLRISSSNAELIGATLTPSPRENEAGIWYFNWKPNKILQGPYDRKDISLRLEARSVEVNTPTAVSFSAAEEFLLTVLPSRLRPIIQSDTVPATIQQGQVVPFTMTVSDPSTEGRTQAPALQILQYSGANSAENPRHDGSNLIRKTAVSEPSGSGVFTYSLEINTQGVKLPKESDPSSDGANLCFNVNLMSVTTRNSTVDSRPYCIRVMFSVPVPRIKWLTGSTEGSRIQELVAGMANSIKFEAWAPGDNGVISVSVNANKNWPSEKDGQPQFVCEPGDEKPTSKKTCTVTWTPSCKLSPNGQTLTSLRVQMTNRSGAITRRANDDVMALVIGRQDTEACTKTAAKVPAPTRAEAASAPASASAPAEAASAAPNPKPKQKKAPAQKTRAKDTKDKSKSIKVPAEGPAAPAAPVTPAAPAALAPEVP